MSLLSDEPVDGLRPGPMPTVAKLASAFVSAAGGGKSAICCPSASKNCRPVGGACSVTVVRGFVAAGAEYEVPYLLSGVSV